MHKISFPLWTPLLSATALALLAPLGVATAQEAPAIPTVGAIGLVDVPNLGADDPVMTAEEFETGRQIISNAAPAATACCARAPPANL